MNCIEGSTDDSHLEIVEWYWVPGETAEKTNKWYEEMLNNDN